MNTNSVECLINTISRYIHLVSCQTWNSIPTQNDCIQIVKSLKILKPLLHEVVDCKISSDEVLCKECQQLDVSVNEARDFLDCWSSKISKISYIVRSERHLINIQKSSLVICCILEKKLQSSSSALKLPAVKELKSLELERIAGLLDENLKMQEKDNDHLIKIVEVLGLNSSQELLAENMALESEKIEIEQEFNQKKEELERMNQIIDIFFYIREWMLELDHLKTINGADIPPFFRCPLTLILMTDPVIAASGQTYERASIQKWLDHGFTTCPKTRQNLAHKNLIPNHTVKSLIRTWCREHNAGNIVDDIDNLQITASPPEIYESPEEVSSSSLQSNSATSYNLRNDSYRSTSRSSSSSDATQHPKTQLGNKMVEKGWDDLATQSHIEKLLEDLSGESEEARTKAAAELRSLAKFNMRNRVTITKSGAIPLLLSLLTSPVQATQEHAVTAILNLSIDPESKSLIANTGALDPLIHVLKYGNSEARENSAAALFSLSDSEEQRKLIGRSDAVKGLVDLLRDGSLRGQKDAATALFNLAGVHENKIRIMEAGAVNCLMGMIQPSTEMTDKALAIVATLATIPEGRKAIAREEGVPALVALLERGSRIGKENAASILWELCSDSAKHCFLVLQEGAVPALVTLTQCGTNRAKQKAQQLLSHFRSQREGKSHK